MSLTLWDCIWIGIIFITGSILSLYFVFPEDEKILGLKTFIVTLILTGALAFGLHWYNTSTASGIRSYKDHQSNMSNGIEREVTITAEDGREIFHYEGKIDIESNHEDNYIKFESEEGKRYIIYYGITDTIKIIEK